ncbi:MAG: hypothetical protein ABI882_16825 [Acidobacteriota bacterium]
MQTSRRFSRVLLAFAAMLLLTSVGLAADPGAPYPSTSEASDQKAGSILFYNIYSSSTANPSTTNTRFNITNTSVSSAAFVHLFFVEGGSCSVADRYICLTANQTMTFLASEQDPATTGYLLAIAVDGVLGCPINFNFLIGDEYVKFDTGHFANLGAETIAAIAVTPVTCDENTTTVTISFDGIRYNRVPRVLALDNIGSIADGNSVRVWINRVGGSLFGGGGSTGTFFGILYDDAEQAHSYQLSAGTCQRGFTLNDTNPRTSPRFTVVIPAGQTGWTKLWSTSDVGLFGVAINFNPNAATSAGAYNGGHNLHKLRLTTDSYTMPIFSPGC